MKNLSSKNRTRIIIGSIGAAFFMLCLVATQSVYHKHATLNFRAQFPDKYLKLVNDYYEVDNTDQSVLYIERAIASIWEIEKEVDDPSHYRLDKAVNKLEKLRVDILQNKLAYGEMEESIEFVMNALTYAELDIAKKYAESSDMEFSKTAMRFAMVHSKNAQLFHYRFVKDMDDVELAIEQEVFDQLKEIKSDSEADPTATTLKVNSLVSQVDRIL